MFTDIGTIYKEKMEGKEISLRGWIYRHRTAGKMVFAAVRDPTGIIQVAVKKDKVDDPVG